MVVFRVVADNISDGVKLWYHLPTATASHLQRPRIEKNEIVAESETFAKVAQRNRTNSKLVVFRRGKGRQRWC